jgi:hypothetical protein
MLRMQVTVSATPMGFISCPRKLIQSSLRSGLHGANIGQYRSVTVLTSDGQSKPNNASFSASHKTPASCHSASAHIYWDERAEMHQSSGSRVETTAASRQLVY